MLSPGRMAGGGEPAGRPRTGMTGPRNVRTPQGRVLGNSQSGRPEGQCHRKQTADGGTDWSTSPVRTGKVATVR